MTEAKRNFGWFKGCGPEPAGKNASDEICPAAFDTGLTGSDQCKNAGLSCWVIPGGLCNNDFHRGYKLRSAECLRCEVYQVTRSEEVSQHSYA
ncbi:MAG: hypothetical protein D3910_03890 [Candidatus Electrothrix sp. ATG2]|nr:hypothetical protein [Candidatus Electrothrix sp. ATG2]